MKNEKITLDNIVEVLLVHENLLPCQTPFRITNPIMKQWNTILGYKTNKNPEVPSSRKNFIYLINPLEVPLAVKKQFERYATTPEKYGLPENPSLEKCLKVFDQSNAIAKIAYMVSQIKGLDVTSPIKNFII